LLANMDGVAGGAIERSGSTPTARRRGGWDAPGRYVLVK